MSTNYHNYTTDELIDLARYHDNALAELIASRLQETIDELTDELHELKTETAFNEISEKLQAVESRFRDHHKTFNYLNDTYIDCSLPDIIALEDQEHLFRTMGHAVPGLTRDEFEEVLNELCNGIPVPAFPTEYYQVRMADQYTPHRSISYNEIVICSVPMDYVTEVVEIADLAKRIQDSGVKCSDLNRALSISTVDINSDDDVELIMDYTDRVVVVSVEISKIRELVVKIRKGA